MAQPSLKLITDKNLRSILEYILKKLKSFSDIVSIQSITGDLVDNTDPLNPAIIDAPSDGNQYARQDGAWEQVASAGVSKEYLAFVSVNSSGVPSVQELRNTTGETFTIVRNGAGYNRITASNAVFSVGNVYFNLQDFNINPAVNNPIVRGQVLTSSILDVNILANNSAVGNVDTEHKYYIKIELMS